VLARAVPLAALRFAAASFFNGQLLQDLSVDEKKGNARALPFSVP
jgi:hypothetical protein